MKKRITAKIKAKIFELRLKGYSTGEIARELGIAEYQVVRVLGLI